MTSQGVPAAGQRFDMPIAFGPSPVPDRSEVPIAEVAGITFLSNADALRQLLPAAFDLAGEPIVTVSFIEYWDVDYLGGRGYQEVVVSFPASFRSEAGEITGGYSPILWVSDVGALMAGREYMGLPKLIGALKIERSDSMRHFECGEYDAPLLEGYIKDMKPLSEEQVAKVRNRSQEVRTFGWKHIPGAGGAVDLAYPLVNVMRWDYEQAWTGEGRIDFLTPDRIAAPFSSRAAAALASLPVKEWRRAFVGRGRAIIDRVATRRIG